MPESAILPRPLWRRDEALRELVAQREAILRVVTDRYARMPPPPMILHADGSLEPQPIVAPIRPDERARLDHLGLEIEALRWGMREQAEAAARRDDR